MKSLEQIDRWLAGKVRGWTGKVAGSHSKELLEVRREILEHVRDAIEPMGEGRSVFPYKTVTVRVAFEDERDRGAAEAALCGDGGLEEDIRELLAESDCAIPPGFGVRVSVEPDAALAWAERPFEIQYSNEALVGAGETVASKPAGRPRASVTVLRGEADCTECEVEGDRFYIGRLKEVVGEKQGLRRRNDLAFSESETTVSREHAVIRWDVAGGRYRVSDSGSARGTVVFRAGRRLEAQRGSAGVQLKSGDEIHLGNARVRFVVEE